MTFEYDPTQAIEHLRTVDADLRSAIDEVGPFKMELTALSPFQALLRAIVYQQLSGKAAATIYRRVRALTPSTRPPGPRAIIALPAERLREAGMSFAKIAAAKDLAEKTLAGTIPNRRGLRGLTDEEIVSRFTTVRGVGQWTVEMMLIFNLGRPDVLPATDLGIRKGFKAVFVDDDTDSLAHDAQAGLPVPRAILTRGEAWRPYRSVASWYLWRTDAPIPPP